MSANIITDFLTASASGYGQNKAEIFVTDRNSLSADQNLLAAHGQPETRAIIFTDNLPTDKILEELDYLDALQKKRRYAKLGTYFYGHSNADGSLRFDITSNDIHLPVHECPNLLADIQRTHNVLKPLFNAGHTVHIRCFTKENNKDDSWHRDSLLNPEKPIAVRTFGPRGTLIATGAIGFIEAAGPYDVKSAAHAGQGIYLFRGETVHGIPCLEDGRRWVYIFG